MGYNKVKASERWDKYKRRIGEGGRTCAGRPEEQQPSWQRAQALEEVGS
jgi:hypothetical protein